MIRQYSDSALDQAVESALASLKIPGNHPTRTNKKAVSVLVRLLKEEDRLSKKNGDDTGLRFLFHFASGLGEHIAVFQGLFGKKSKPLKNPSFPHQKSFTYDRQIRNLELFGRPSFRKGEAIRFLDWLNKHGAVRREAAAVFDRLNAPGSAVRRITDSYIPTGE